MKTWLHIIVTMLLIQKEAAILLLMSCDALRMYLPTYLPQSQLWVQKLEVTSSKSHSENPIPRSSTELEPYG